MRVQLKGFPTAIAIRHEIWGKNSFYHLLRMKACSAGFKKKNLSENYFINSPKQENMCCFM